MRKIDNEEIKLCVLPFLEMRKLVSLGLETRNNKKWTQGDLARNCGLPKETIIL